MRYILLTLMLLTSGCTKEHKYNEALSQEVQYDTLVSVDSNNNVHIYYFEILGTIKAHVNLLNIPPSLVIIG